MDEISLDIIRVLKWPKEHENVLEEDLPLSYWTITKIINYIRKNKGKNEVSFKSVKRRWDELIKGPLRNLQIIPDSSFLGIRRAVVGIILSNILPLELTVNSIHKVVLTPEEIFKLIKCGNIERISIGNIYNTNSYMLRIELVYKEMEDLKNFLAKIKENLSIYNIKDLYVSSYTSIFEPLGKYGSLKERRLLINAVKNPNEGVNDLRHERSLFKKLISSRAFHIEPIFDSTKFEGLLMFQLIGFIFNRDKNIIKQNLKKLLGDKILLEKSYFNNFFLLQCYAKSISEIEEVNYSILKKYPSEIFLLWSSKSLFNNKVEYPYNKLM